MYFVWEKKWIGLIAFLNSLAKYTTANQNEWNTHFIPAHETHKCCWLSLFFTPFISFAIVYVLNQCRSMAKRFEQAQIMTYYVQWWCCAQQTQTIKKENDRTLLCYPLLCTDFCNWSFFVVVVVVFCLLPLWQSRYFVCTMCTISDSLFM